MPSVRSSSLLFTTSSAAVFSLTNSTFLPSAMRAPMMLEMVWLFPVPGGPWMTKLLPALALAIAMS